MDALGNPLTMILTAGQVHDLAGADALLPEMEAKVLLAGKTAVIQPKRNRKKPRTYDKVQYEARHLIENFFCWVKQFPAIAT